MYVLGISETDNDAGAVLLNGSSVVCGVSEERFSRIKRHAGFPYQSIEWILCSNKLSLKDIDYIAIAKADPLETPERFYRQQTLLRHAIRKKRVFHLWAHPHNFSSGENMFDQFERIIEKLAEAAKSGAISTMTQQEYARQYLMAEARTF